MTKKRLTGILKGISIRAGMLLIVVGAVIPNQGLAWILLAGGFGLVAANLIISGMAAVPPHWWTRFALLLLLGALAITWLLYLSPIHSASPFFDRHGLPKDFLLPDASTFVSFRAAQEFGDATSWTWTNNDAPAK